MMFQKLIQKKKVENTELILSEAAQRKLTKDTDNFLVTVAKVHKHPN
jgi:hypothetical protein